MFTLLNKMMQSGRFSHSACLNGSYEEAIKALSSLQSNSAYLRSVKHNVNNYAKLKETEKYLLRTGITLEQLDDLSVIHVTGTKGKGSTCAFMEVILRQYGFKTGFYSSPHLVSVRERFRLNGEPINETHFARFFWHVYTRLMQKREHKSDMPNYFKFLTILMFHVFLEANIDVAIIEVGIGGELDCTNILRNPVCVGVTSLGLEHTALLGNTLEEIAHQKSGIFKPYAAAFTVPQTEPAMRILEKRAVERRCRSLQEVSFQNHKWNDILSSLGFDINDAQRQNVALSITMVCEWLKSRCDKSQLIINDKYADNFRDSVQSNKDDIYQTISLDKIAAALVNCKWPGRTQILRTNTADFFLDGAHTIESMDHCISWFKRTSRKTSSKFLIFNTSGDRSSHKLLKLLKPLNFDRVYFAPNYAGVITIEDLNSPNYVNIDEQKNKCKENCEMWGENSVMKNNIADVLYDVKWYASSRIAGADKIEILVTGSLYMIGALLTILDPNLSMTSDF